MVPCGRLPPRPEPPWNAAAPAFLPASEKGASDPYGENASDGPPLPEQPPVTSTVPLPELQHLCHQGQQLLPWGTARGSRQHGQAQLQSHGGGVPEER